MCASATFHAPIVHVDPSSWAVVANILVAVQQLVSVFSGNVTWGTYVFNRRVCSNVLAEAARLLAIEPNLMDVITCEGVIVRVGRSGAVNSNCRAEKNDARVA